VAQWHSLRRSGGAGRVEQDSFIFLPDRGKLACRLRQQTSPRALSLTRAVVAVENHDLDPGLRARSAQPIDLGRGREEPPRAAVPEHVPQGAFGELGVEQNRHGAAAERR
jgi:hypothetical protein